MLVLNNRKIASCDHDPIHYDFRLQDEQGGASASGDYAAVATAKIICAKTRSRCIRSQCPHPRMETLRKGRAVET